jgi:hypothetical protein
MPLVNDAPLSAEARELAAGSYRWAFRVCHDLLRRDAYRGMDREIAEGAALYGLCLAARKFDPALGSWPTHAARWIKGQVRDEARIWFRRGLTCRNGGKDGPAPPAPEVGPMDGAVAMAA